MVNLKGISDGRFGYCCVLAVGQSGLREPLNLTG